MDAKAKALAQLQHWNDNGYSATGPSWGTVQAPQAKKQRGRGGILSSLISEAGGAGGAAGGAAIGTAIAPGVGTLAGAILGGFLGGTGGRGIENKVRDNQNFFGKGGSAKSALTEGGLDAALSGLGTGFQLAKGAKAASSLSGVAGDLKPIIPTRVGGLESAGKNFKAGAGGYGIGATKTGASPLNSVQSDKIGQTLKDLKIPTAAPETQARHLDSRIANLNNFLTKSYSSANVPLQKSEIKNLQTKITQRIANETDVSGASRAFIQSQLGRLAKSGDVEGLWNFNKSVAKNANFGKSPSSKLVDREAISRITRDEVKNFLNTKVKGIAEKNTLYHDATNAREYILKASKDTNGGLVQKVTGSTAFKTGEAKLGGALESVGKFTAGTGGPMTKVTEAAKFQSPGNLAEALMSSAAPQDPNAMTTGMADTQMGMTPQDPALGGMDTQMSAPQAMTLPEALQQAQQLLGGNQKPGTYLDYAKAIMDSQGGGGAGGNVGKVSAQAYGLAQQGSSALDKLSQLVASDPGVVNRTATPGRGLPVVGGFLGNATKTSEYDTLGFAAVSSLLRAQSGAAVPDSEVRSYMRAYLPRPGDSPETINRKLQTIHYDFQTVLNGGQGNFNTSSAYQDPAAASNPYQ